MTPSSTSSNLTICFIATQMMGMMGKMGKGMGKGKGSSKGKGMGGGEDEESDEDEEKDEKEESVVGEEEIQCPSKYPFLGQDSSERLLLREGIIDSIPADLCTQSDKSKNVILVIGDGMGWEMIRAGAIAKLVLAELEDMGCDTKTGCPNSDVGDAVMEVFAGRTLSDYYTEGT